MFPIPESDWKKFKAIHPIAHGRFYERAAAELARRSIAADQTPEERFWSVFNYANNRRKEAAEVFDDYRRSTAVLTLLRLRTMELITDAELADFSPKTRDFIVGLREFASKQR